MSEPGDDVEALYAVPTHLKASDSIGWIPSRLFFVGAGALVFSAFLAYGGFIRFGVTGLVIGPVALWAPWAAIWFGLVPIVICLPFMLWFLDPPAEHGLMHGLAYFFSKKELGAQDIDSLRDLRIEGDTVYLGSGTECRAILALPTVNLDLASTASRRRHRRLIGALLDGISSHSVQLIVRAQALPQSDAIERMRLNRNPFSRKLAAWLASHHEQKEAIDRRRYLVIPAPDLETLADRVETISRSFRQAGLDPVRLDEPADIRDLLNNFWTWRPHPDRLGPERVARAATYLQSDGEYMQAYVLAKTPSTITTNWWFRLTDGDLACDVSMTCEQQDLLLAKFRLDMKYNTLAASNPSPARQIALDQIKALRLAFEARVRPWNAQIVLVVRGITPKARDRNAKRLKQQMRDMGATVRLLRWEQYQAIVSAQPLCLPTLPSRPLYIESGTLARTTLLSASTLQMADGVPWGLSGSTPILLTTRGMRTGRHFGWFGFTGSGKGFGVRCYLARRHFADRLRIFMWDADDSHHEYAGRFTEFLEGVRLVVNSLDELYQLRLDPLWQVIAFDVSGMPPEQQPAAFAHVKLMVQEHVLAFPGESAFVVDEATTLASASDQSGALALGDAVQKWRKYGVEVHVITQRVSDWFGTAVGRKIQGNLAVKWYGAQEDSELHDIAVKVNLSSEERERIGSAGIGQGLLVAFGRRVWADLYEHASHEEYAAYHTDPPDKVEVLARRSA